MKHILFAILCATAASGFAQKEIPVSSNVAGDYHAVVPEKHPARIITWYQESPGYYRDANGTPIPEESFNSGIPVDSSGAYFRMLERAKKFPEDRNRERLRCEPGLNHASERAHLKY